MIEIRRKTDLTIFQERRICMRELSEFIFIRNNVIMTFNDIS